ncbi:serine dehydratase subunit alpha family protein [Cedecea sp. S5-13]|uniref:L-cysteine desulfidase family protein n=1 Tax=Cedecea selenatireducens TaxID=3144416 RepID=UPI0035CCE223
MLNPELNPAWAELIRAVKQNVRPAVGCTEPISLALASALAASHLEGNVERIVAKVSPNLMKNGMGVTVPGTGMVGLPIAAAVGALGGNPQAGLEVLKSASVASIAAGKLLLANGRVSVSICEPCDEILYASATVFTANAFATVTIAGGHSRVVRVEKQGKVLFDRSHEPRTDDAESCCDLAKFTLSQIVEFAGNVPVESIGFIRDAALLNNALSHEGLRAPYGLHIGATLQRQRARGLLAKDLFTDIIIRTSAASDARMGGACLPAMSNSGSGNQGIAATMPVVVVAEHLGSSEEQLTRALILSHLTAIYIHHQLPTLSALCAATTAAMGAAAGMLWLIDGSYRSMTMAISSMIGDVSGMICDGASNSCAMKVSTSVSSAWKAVLMALDNTAVTGNEGIVDQDIEKSISNLCALASRSMQATDRQIIDIMANKTA